jgi:hypothetical protein
MVDVLSVLTRAIQALETHQPGLSQHLILSSIGEVMAVYRQVFNALDAIGLLISTINIGSGLLTFQKRAKKKRIWMHAGKLHMTYVQLQHAALPSKILVKGALTILVRDLLFLGC